MPRQLSLLILGLVAASLGSLAAMLAAAGGAPDGAGTTLDALAPIAAVGAAVAAALGIALWRAARATLVAPAAALARDVRTLLQASRIDRALRQPTAHALGDLPEAVAELTDRLRGARREVVRAMATATARTEQEKGWLELILLELAPHGVAVCNLEHRILLYNQEAARVFDDREALGLGRSLLDLVSEAPLRHALESLELRLKSSRRDLGTSVVCTTRDQRRMLRVRVNLVLDPSRVATGYAASFEDISREFEARRVSMQLRRAITHEIRNPLAGLRAAAETLASGCAGDGERRHMLESILTSESERLTTMVESLAELAETEGDEGWPLAAIHSNDLLVGLADQVEKQHAIRIAVRGQPTWITGDSHLLILALTELVAAVAAAGGRELAVSAGSAARRSFVELVWDGEPIGIGTLDRWLDDELDAAPGTTIGTVLERHGSEPWSGRRPEGLAFLHVPLPSGAAPESPADAGPAHPELYDFDLMYARGLTGELEDRPLDELAFVVFDTETTGLRPAAGDEIISIAGVRVTGGRVLESETFTTLVDPRRPIPADSIRFHGITDEMVEGQPAIGEVLPRFREFVGDAVLVAHNAAFDMKFLKLKESAGGVRFDNPVIDTLLLSLLVEGEDEDHSLDGICDRLDVQIVDRHSALGDALATAHVLVHLLERLAARGVRSYRQMLAATDMTEQLKARAHHF